MRIRRLLLLVPMSLATVPAHAQRTEQVELASPPQHYDLKTLQARFAKMQHIARRGSPEYELRFAEADASLLRQYDDGFIRLPEDLLTAAANPETVDFFMMLALSYATQRPVEAPKLSSTAKVALGVIGFLGANAASAARRPDIGDRLARPPRAYEQSESPETLNPELRGLSWSVASGGCEARIVEGLQSLARRQGSNTFSKDARQILRALGTTAYTPNDRCAPLQ